MIEERENYESIEFSLSDTVCQYFDIKKFNSKFKKYEGLSFLHLNIRSLPKHLDNLTNFLNSIDHRFKVIALSETRLTSNSSIPHNLSLDGYSFVLNKTEASAGGTAIYICNSINFKERHDLSNTYYKCKHLESTFIEIVQHRKKNIIVGCVYKHPGMSTNELTDEHFAPLLDKINMEKKQGVLLGDFNINLLEYNIKNEVGRFVDTATSHSFFPTISIPTRITDMSSTLIDNIFISPDENKYESGNFLTGISDHLAQFLIPTTISPDKNFNTKTFYRDWKSFNKESFIEDLKNFNWDNLLLLENNNPDYSFELFFKKFNELLESHVPLKRFSKRQLKSVSKPWITKGIKKSIMTRDSLLKKFHSEKRRRSAIYDQYKFYRNRVVDLIRQSKSNYYVKFFNDNLKNSKKIWNGIHELTATKKRSDVTKISLDIAGELTSNPKIIAESFNNYFSQIAEKLRAKLPPTPKSYRNYLNTPPENSFFLSPTNTDEIKKVILSLDRKKATGPYSIPCQVFSELSNEIAPILSSIFNLSFQTGKFVEILK